jgi:isopenicillin N synthase-like dioxygenase
MNAPHALAPHPSPTASALSELQKEARMGGWGDDDTSREVRVISLRDFEARRLQIADELWAAAVDVGFFQLSDHGIDLAAVRHAFARSAEFFALPDEVKARWPHNKARNVGWETRAQVRPSTGTADQKESYQITRPHMQGLWPSDAELPGFQADMLAFEAQCHALGMKVLSCFALKLGFDVDFFTRAHDPASDTYQSTLRLLHYYGLPADFQPVPGMWRAGAHTDFDVLTLLFQRTGQGGLQVLPGKEMEGEAWTTVDPRDEVITCNIGDMLMRWSDDVLPSNFHRVRPPMPGEYLGSRYSIAYFAQANTDAIIQGPAGKYPPISAGDYLRQRVAANFAKPAY